VFCVSCVENTVDLCKMTEPIQMLFGADWSAPKWIKIQIIIPLERAV